MDRDVFLRRLNNNHKGLVDGIYDDYEADFVDTYKSLIISGEITVFYGFICYVSGKISDNKYTLVPYTGLQQELQNDSAFTEYHYWHAVAERKNCDKCGKIYFVSKEEDDCPYCKR